MSGCPPVPLAGTDTTVKTLAEYAREVVDDARGAAEGRGAYELGPAGTGFRTAGTRQEGRPRRKGKFEHSPARIRGIAN